MIFSRKGYRILGVGSFVLYVYLKGVLIGFVVVGLFRFVVVI